MTEHSLVAEMRALCVDFANRIVDMHYEQRKAQIADDIRSTIEEITSEHWRWQWAGHETIERIIVKRIEHHIETTFAEALDGIAREKARRKVIERAKRNKIDPSAYPLLNDAETEEETK